MIAPRGGWREKKRRTGSSMVEDNDFVPKADNYTSLVLLCTMISGAYHFRI
jgi:hypothetical protein